MSPPARVDVVVVGAGAAGCVMARRLAEAGADVLLVEAGAERAPSRAGVLDVGPDSKVVTRYRAGLGDGVVELPRGRTLGGSGAVNGGYCLPARPADLAAWGPDWPRRYRVGLARAAERLRPRLAPMGAVASRLARAFPAEVTAVPQARAGSRRVTAFDAWDPAGAGARVITGARVRELRWAGGRPGGRCDGVVLDDDEEVAAREVILCAGTIATAAILFASGVGEPSGHPVGRGVQEHPELLLDLYPDAPNGPTADRSGGFDPATPPGPSDPGGSLPPLLTHVVRLRREESADRWSAPGQPGGAPEVEVRPYSVPLHRVIPGLAPQPHRIGLALMNPRGRGGISPGRDGVRVDMSDDRRDAAVLRDAATAVAHRLGLSGADEILERSVVRSTSHHLAGSARIGAVVDGSGRVLDVPGLRVADASVFPFLPRSGPYYSVLAVAEDLAARVLTQRRW